MLEWMISNASAVSTFALLIAVPLIWVAVRNAREKAAQDEVVTAPADSRYLGLVTVLESHEEDELTMTFLEFEEAVGAGLPPSATRHRSWWSNSTRNSQTRLWLASGWRVKDVDLEGERVTFVRA